MEQKKRWVRFYDGVIDTLAVIAGVLTILVMLLTCYLVVMRYIFLRPPAWIVELSEYILLYITFFGAAWLLRKNGHVNVDIVLIFLPNSWKRALNVITAVLGSISCLILTAIASWVTANNYIRGLYSIQTLSVPKWILLAVIPLGSFLLAIQFLRRLNTALAEYGRSDRGDKLNQISGR